MKQLMKYLSPVLIILGIFLLPTLILTISKSGKLAAPQPTGPAIKIKSIDTMKYSRDIAREKSNDPSFDAVLEKQVSDISQTGATHVAIATPYDSEFVPYLKRWVGAARKNHLKVWFRGNLSGWEHWFNYSSIDKEAHIKNTEDFILNNSDLFEDGDIFTSCAECENGGSGDPRQTGDVEGFRNFLIEEYHSNELAFSKINKKVATGYFSMNYDVAKLIMDPATTKALGGIAVIDHYVASTDQLAADVKALALKSGGKIVLGEFGAPIEDISGKMTEEEQANWINRALDNLNKTPEVIGVNYWTNAGSSTQLWNEDGTRRKAAAIIEKYYKRH